MPEPDDHSKAPDSPAEPSPCDDSDSAEIHTAPGGLKFRINEDGSVTFENLPPEMMDIALALNPDAVLACEVPAPIEEPAEE